MINDNYNIVANATFTDSFNAEDRIFLKEKEYPIYKIDGGYKIVGENGEFNFTPKGWGKLKPQWEKEVGMKINEVEVEE